MSVLVGTVVSGLAATVRVAEDSGGSAPAFDPASVTPGVVGFTMTALFALAVIFLGWDLVRRLRRSRYRAEIQEELQAELAEREAAGAEGADGAGAAGGAQTDAPDESRLSE